MLTLKIYGRYPVLYWIGVPGEVRKIPDAAKISELLNASISGVFVIVFLEGHLRGAEL